MKQYKVDCTLHIGTWLVHCWDIVCTVEVLEDESISISISIWQGWSRDLLDICAKTPDSIAKTQSH